MCGVYMIRCRRNGMYYIGGTTLSFVDRFDRHRSALRRQKAPRLLQACHDLYGMGSLEFLVLKAFPPEEVADREAQAIAELKPDLNVYGVRKGLPRGARAEPVQHLVDGELLTLGEMVKRSGLASATIRARMLRGLTGSELLKPAYKTVRKAYGGTY